jgi:hypothetical protein
MKTFFLFIWIHTHVTQSTEWISEVQVLYWGHRKKYHTWLGWPCSRLPSLCLFLSWSPPAPSGVHHHPAWNAYGYHVVITINISGCMTEGASITYWRRWGRANSSNIFPQPQHNKFALRCVLEPNWEHQLTLLRIILWKETFVNLFRFPSNKTGKGKAIHVTGREGP